jgi:hypothetical protein
LLASHYQTRPKIAPITLVFGCVVDGEVPNQTRNDDRENDTSNRNDSCIEAAEGRSRLLGFFAQRIIGF